MTTYYCGDLCYVLSDKEWDVLCAVVPSRAEMIEQIHTEDGYDCEFFLNAADPLDPRSFICFSTAYGDGCYLDQNGREYSVDSGTLGLIDIEFISDESKLKDALCDGLGHLITVGDEIDASECYFDDDEGAIVFGDQHSKGVRIETGE